MTNRSESPYETIVRILPATNLVAINVIEVEAVLKAATGPIDVSGRPIQTELGVSVEPDVHQVGYQFRVTIDCDEFKVLSAIRATFTVPDASAFNADAELVQEFGARIAYPAAYPYLRERIQTLCSWIGLPQILLPLWRASDLPSLHPIDTESATDIA